MIDEDLAVEVLERLAADTPETAQAVAGAVFLRPAPDLVVVAGITEEGAAWWLGLTDWGRLSMGGDMAAAAAWLADREP